jgi:hypothetical protein
MRRCTFKAADDDSLPVIIPRNDEAVVPISPERVRRLRKHLVASLRAFDILEGEEEQVDFIETQLGMIEKIGLERYIQLQSGSAE